MRKSIFLSFLCIMIFWLNACSQRENMVTDSSCLPESRSTGLILDYPPVEAMVNHFIVIDAMDMAWNQMKNRITSGSGRSEYGFYIRYLFEQNTFGVDLIVEGPLITGCAGTNGTINLGIPGDNLAVCGFYHCHTSIENCPTGNWRYTGPSEADLNFARNQNLPGILYDYAAPIIIAGSHHANDPYKIYTFGPNARPEIYINN